MNFRGNVIESGTLLLVFGICLFIPSLIFVVLKQPSYASGIVCSTSLIILISLYKVQYIDSLSAKYCLKIGIISAIILVFHGFIAFLITKQLDFQRFLGSVFLLLLMFFCGYRFVVILNNTSPKYFSRSLNFILFILLILSFSGGVLSYIPFSYYETLNKPIFPFMEPSHFSLIIAPFFLWAIVTRKKKIHKILIILYALFILTFTSNLTLVSVIFLGILLAFGLKKFALFIPMLLLIVSVLSFDLGYYTKRVDIEDNNLSTLVWLQGWEEAYINFGDSFGFGIGLQQFGVIDPKGDAANMILGLTEDYMNRYDGGTFASKLIGEFGIFGGGIIFFLLSKIYQSLLFLKGFSLSRNESVILIFYHCCVSYFVIEIFVRSMSYIAPGFFMFMVGLIGITLHNRRQRYQIFDDKKVG